MCIDASRGDSDDRSALEIFDACGIDDDGKPCMEQVLEYNGKITGDDLGEIAYWYGMLYNEAFCIVECIGGYGDATVLALVRLGYTNLFYDDPNLKTYTIQREAFLLSSIGAFVVHLPQTFRKWIFVLSVPARMIC